MNAELEALEQNHTSLPPGRKAIGCKWLYKTKFNSDDTVNKYKARLVIQGCIQRQGVDYHETFAPVAKMTTVRALLAITVVKVGFFAKWMLPMLFCR